MSKVYAVTFQGIFDGDPDNLDQLQVYQTADRARAEARRLVASEEPEVVAKVDSWLSAGLGSICVETLYGLLTLWTLELDAPVIIEED